ncbi:MAG: hypothetical protein ACEQSA_03705 [Weeksellaceae bacterium]
MEGNLGRHDIQPDTKAEILPVNQTAQFEPVQPQAERKGPTLAQKAAQIGILTFGILATYAGSQYPPIAEALARLSPTDPQGGLVEPTRTIVPTYTSEPLPTSTARPPRPTRTPTAEPTTTNTPEPTATPTLTEADVTATAVQATAEAQATIDAIATPEGFTPSAEFLNMPPGSVGCISPELCFEGHYTIPPENMAAVHRVTIDYMIEGNPTFFANNEVYSYEDLAAKNFILESTAANGFFIPMALDDGYAQMNPALSTPFLGLIDFSKVGAGVINKDSWGKPATMQFTNALTIPLPFGREEGYTPDEDDKFGQTRKGSIKYAWGFLPVNPSQPTDGYYPVIVIGSGNTDTLAKHALIGGSDGEYDAGDTGELGRLDRQWITAAKMYSQFGRSGMTPNEGFTGAFNNDEYESTNYRVFAEVPSSTP